MGSLLTDLNLCCHSAALWPGPQPPGLCSETTVLYSLAAGIYWIPDALQLHRVSEDGALAFHSGMDCHLLHFHSGNREDERGNDFVNENGREMLAHQI